MNPFLSFIICVFIALPSIAAVWIGSFIGFNQTVLFSTGYSLVGGIFAYSITALFLKFRFLRKNHLTRKEYNYIKKNLETAKQKILRLNKALISIRHLPSLKQRIEFMRITRKIYSLTKKEPKRFYQAERFYYSHLDSAVELAEKYVFLMAQPTKNQELNESLNETRKTLEELKKSVEKDLYQVLSNDIDQLHFEIDVAKQSINKIAESEIHDESRRLK